MWGDEIAGGFLGQGRSSVFLGKVGSHWSVSNRSEMIWLTFEESPCRGVLGKGRRSLGDHIWGSKKWLISDTFWKLTQQDWVTDGVWDVRKQFEYDSQGFGPAVDEVRTYWDGKDFGGRSRLRGEIKHLVLGINVRCLSHSPVSVLRRQDLDKGMWLEM